MKLYTINLENYIKSKLPIDAYIWLDLMRLGKPNEANLIGISKESIDMLVDNELITPNRLLYINNINKLFSSNSKFKVDWIEEWYNLWPKGVKSMDYYVKADIKSCDTKMYAFINKYEFNKDEILEATKQYINRLKNRNYEGIMISHNFISKNNVSTLATCCENLDIKPEDSDWASQNA